MKKTKINPGGVPFFVIGVAFLAIGSSSSVFLGVGIAFMVIGITMMATNIEPLKKNKS